MATITISFDGKSYSKQVETLINGKSEFSAKVGFSAYKTVAEKKKFDKKNKIITVRNSKFYIPNYKEDLIQGCLYNSYEYFEENYLIKTDTYLPKNPTIIDIGANIGNHTLYWANEVHAKKIYSFEPVKKIFNILKKNIEINNLDKKVVLYNMAVSDENTKGAIESFDKQNMGGTRLKISDNKRKNTIPFVTLDSINFTDKKIDLIKIDVEGMDYLVLTGAIKTIQKYKPVILMESFPTEYNISSRILKALGYKIECKVGSFEYIYLYDK